MQVAWYVPVILRVIVAHGIVLSLVKFLGKQSVAKRNFLQFLFCFLYALIFSLWQKQLVVNEATAPVILLGFLNGVGAYCQWQAIQISLSQNALFTFWDDIIAMTLAYIVLSEGKFLNLGIVLGILLSLGAVISLALSGLQKGGQSPISWQFLGYVGTYSVFWGVAVFSMRYFGAKHLSTATFLPCWYGGSVLAGFLIFSREKGEAVRFSMQDFVLMPIFSISVLAALALQYWSFCLAPLVVVQPIFLVSEMILPALIGLYIFHERKELTPRQKFFFAMGILGGILIGVNF